ncbi:DUF7018 domain-containing (lipo)protein [Bacillus toyonensis]|uniref:DUF7018 domain-containing (lipo)protein n=1 Tax=Bacillus toyonensis TaxID=155322 RepID=UPI000BF4EAAC|nr:hypothetical protein [Bacillus toyonensis]PGF05293.1 hypothetical protein COM61_02465 [Bacillus toyonensis]
MKRLVGVAVPAMLLFGCGAVDKDTSPKTEEVSKETNKEKISEKEYPLFVCENIIEFTNKIDEYSNTVRQAVKGNGDLQDVLASVDELEDVLNKMKNVDAPSKYEDKQKVMQEGVDEANKGLELIRDGMKQFANGEDNQARMQGKEKASEGVEVVKHAGNNIWTPVVKDLVSEDSTVYERALRNKSH